MSARYPPAGYSGVFGVGVGAVLVAVIEGLPGCLGGASWNGSLGMKYGPERRQLPVADHLGPGLQPRFYGRDARAVQHRGPFFDAVAKGVHRVVFVDPVNERRRRRYVGRWFWGGHGSPNRRCPTGSPHSRVCRSSHFRGPRVPRRRPPGAVPSASVLAMKLAMIETLNGATKALGTSRSSRHLGLPGERRAVQPSRNR